MSDITVKRPNELESYQGQGQFVYAGKSLGVTSLGMNILNLPPGWPDYPEHDHGDDGHEEVYLVLEGRATLQAGGRTWPLEKGTMARVGPTEKRKIVPGPEGVTLLALGGNPGKPYKASWGRRSATRRSGVGPERDKE